MSGTSHPVFFDDSGRRWSLILRIGAGLAFLFSLVGALFSVSILLLPASSLSMKEHLYSHGPVPKIESKEEAARHFLASRTRDELLKRIRLEKTRGPRPARSAPNSTVIGFYVNWDTSSYSSLAGHINDLTYVMPQWFYLTPDGSGIDSRYDANQTADGDVARVCHTSDVPLIAMLDNIDKSTRSFDWARLRTLLSDPAKQTRLAEQLRDRLLSRTLVPDGFAGVNLDLEPNVDVSTLPKAEAQTAERLIHDEYPKFVKRISDVLRPAHLMVTVDLSLGDSTLDYGAIADACDFIVLMLYDQHTPDGNPGPIASQEWVEQCASRVFDKVDSSKVVLGLGNYCYDWPVRYGKDMTIIEDASGEVVTNGPGHKVGLSAALGIAAGAGEQVEMDDADRNPYFTYDDEGGVGHLVYMLDAVTAYNQIVALRDYQPRGAALWYLGSEDPSIWSFFKEGKLGTTVKPSDLRMVRYNEVDDEPNSQGEIVELASTANPGEREIKRDGDGLIVSETYSHYPSSYVLDRFGDMKNAVALTFDDGPDPTWTPRILKVLEENHVPATFFVVGKYADEYPGIVRQCWDAGCEIGNHTFTHPSLLAISKLRTELELNATQRVIESIIGRSTHLLRPPYGEGSDTDPDKKSIANQSRLLVEVQKLGYVTVGMNIDPNDYELPGVGKIVSSVEDQLSMVTPEKVRIDNHVILLHDGGGHSREQTVEALPPIIKRLKARGYRFVTVSGLLGPGAHDRLFTPVPQRQGAIAGFDRMIFEGGFVSSQALAVIFAISIVLGILRILLVAPLAIIQARRSRRPASVDFAPPVTVIAAAYNEEKVIANTVRTVLASDYPDLRMVVVDDGSTDATSQVVADAFAGDPRVKLIRKKNGGKSTALNLGIAQAETEIIVCVDADTIFTSDTVRNLVRRFSDPEVVAVAGNVKVGNRSNPLTIWQSVEYITSQNFDRRAYAALGAVAVVPGAVGAWRRSVVSEAGGYNRDTLAEDTDLTFRVALMGHKVVTENDALAYTEAPDSLRDLAKQRFRWAFGTLQCLWKYRGHMLRRKHGAFGLFVMPAMWIYSIFFQAFSPVVDIAVILSLFSHEFMAVLSYYALFFVIDLVGSALAFRLDREDPRQLFWLFWQRFFYRQFMYYIILKSIAAALRGGLVGWGKLHRKGTVAAGR